MTTTYGETIGWGVLAPGRIARNFVKDLLQVPDARLVASGSRSLERAEAFAAELGGRAHGSYEELVSDPEVDVVYVASPHAFHEEHVMLALDAGKAVLCEKAMTLDAASTQRLFDVAAERGLFLMEAMWMATNPLVRKVRGLLGTPEAPGEHGVAKQIHADLGFVVDRDPSDRLLDPAQGGGALLDMGVYPLTFAHLMLGEPERLVGVGALSERGIDLDVAIAGLYPHGATAALSSSLTSNSTRSGTIATTTGAFEMGRNFHSPTQVRWTAYDGKKELDSRWIELVPGEDEALVGRGYGNEAMEVHRCLRAGATTSALVPPEQTVSLMRQMDDLLAQLGVTYDR